MSERQCHHQCAKKKNGVCTSLHECPDMPGWVDPRRQEERIADLVVKKQREAKEREQRRKNEEKEYSRHNQIY